jgi:hypothetical protein
MAQMTLYLDEDTRRRVEEAAAREQVSVSRWVKDRLKRALDAHWPPGYFELLGSLSEGDLERPGELAPGGDSPREPLP